MITVFDYRVRSATDLGIEALIAHLQLEVETAVTEQAALIAMYRYGMPAVRAASHALAAGAGVKRAADALALHGRVELSPEQPRNRIKLSTNWDIGRQ